MNKDKQYYINEYRKYWNECLKKAKRMILKGYKNIDTIEEANKHFEENVNANQIVGYYLDMYESDAFKEWLQNIDGLELTEQDYEVTRIFVGLYDFKLK